MTELRYMGSGTWTPVVTDDKGKFTGYDTVKPGDVVKFDNDQAERMLAKPRHLRLFVKAGGEEDPHGDNYRANRLESVRGNAVPYPELEMGSTVVGHRTITRSEDDNPEGHPVAGPDEGPQSDNTEVNLNAEVQAEADKAAERKRAELNKARQAPSRPANAPSEQKKS